MAQQERKGKQIKTSGFLLSLLRFVLRKQALVQQLGQPEATMPSDKCLSAPGEKNSFCKAPELWGTLLEDHTSFSASNEELYIPSSRVCECSHWGHSAVSLAQPTLKCWLDAWHFNIATLPETWPAHANIFEVPKLIWPKSLFSRTAMFSFSSSKENSWSE